MHDSYNDSPQEDYTAMIETIRLTYPCDPWGAREQGNCLVTIWAPDEKGLIVVTQRHDNAGLSVTNGIEYIATEIHKLFTRRGSRLALLPSYHLVEHYPRPGRLGDFALIQLDRDPAGGPGRYTPFCRPRWTHLTEEDLDALAPAGSPRPSAYLATIINQELAHAGV